MACSSGWIAITNISSSDVLNPGADMTHDVQQFDSMFKHSDDPWQFKTRWYEMRKRVLTLAALPSQRFASAYEPGCANGELTSELATRCDRVVATDGAARAVELARDRVATLKNVTVRQAWVPQDWPDETFDLIVISELAYYLSRTDLDGLITKARVSLNPNGTLLACHWRPTIEGCAFNGDEVHRRIHAGIGLPRLLEISDADLRIDVWCKDHRSVALREGLR
jgi:SAM-dependent methyltransferase